jgi:hypothetical protein
MSAGDACSRLFAVASNLRRHRKIHTKRGKAAAENVRWPWDSLRGDADLFSYLTERYCSKPLNQGSFGFERGSTGVSMMHLVGRAAGGGTNMKQSTTMWRTKIMLVTQTSRMQPACIGKVELPNMGTDSMKPY